MAEYKWPDADKRTFIGKRISRIDGPHKVSGRAKYSFDINRPGMLYGKILRSPYAHARVKAIDTSAAEAMPGVKAIHLMVQPDTSTEQSPTAELNWVGASIVAVAAVDEQHTSELQSRVDTSYALFCLKKR